MHLQNVTACDWASNGKLSSNLHFLKHCGCFRRAFRIRCSFVGSLKQVRLGDASKLQYSLGT